MKLRTVVFVALAGCPFPLEPEQEASSVGCPELDGLATQVGDEGTTTPFRGSFLAGERDDAPRDGRILVDAKPVAPVLLWVDGDPVELATAPIWDPPGPAWYGVVLPPAGGWPVGVDLEVTTELDAAYGSEPASLAFRAEDRPASPPAASVEIDVTDEPWSAGERSTAFRAEQSDDAEAWSWTVLANGAGEPFAVGGVVVWGWIFQHAITCDEVVDAPPCATATPYGPAGEAGTPVDSCAP
ncbi:MAG: hypothetical protein R3F59_35945 [Myxococcota bacterium]